MSDKPKPLTKAEFEYGPAPMSPGEWLNRITATLNALFRYRERTCGMYDDFDSADNVASEEWIE